MRRLVLAGVVLLFLAGCFHEPMVTLRVRNTGKQTVTEVELDYGKAFGISELKPGEARERKVYFPDRAELTLVYFDSAGKGHKENGPQVSAQSTGVIEVQIGDTGATWHPDLHH